MSSWLSNLFGKRKQDNEVGDSDAVKPQYDDPNDEPVSPLAMMNEKSPEAWLGQFLPMGGAPPALQYSSINAAKQNDKLAAHLASVLEAAGKDQPRRLLDPAYAEELKQKYWAAWWRA